MEMLEILVIRSPPPGRACGSASPAPRESTHPRVKSMKIESRKKFKKSTSASDLGSKSKLGANNAAGGEGGQIISARSDGKHSARSHSEAPMSSRSSQFQYI